MDIYAHAEATQGEYKIEVGFSTNGLRIIVGKYGDYMPCDFRLYET